MCFQSLQLVRCTLGHEGGERREELIDISEWQLLIKKAVNWAECGQTHFVLALGPVQAKQDLAPEFNLAVCIWDGVYVFVCTWARELCVIRVYLCYRAVSFLCSAEERDSGYASVHT